MSAINIKRITKELAEIKSEIKSGNVSNIVEANTVGTDITKWTAIIRGPDGSPFEGGKFQLSLTFGSEYPFKPPRITFTSRMHHPNISTVGEICLDILKDQWSPALSITKVLLSICSLLVDPNPNDPLNALVASEYKNNRKLYDENVRRLVASSTPTRKSCISDLD